MTGSLRKRTTRHLAATAAVALALSLVSLPAVAGHTPDHYSLSWSRSCSSLQTVVSHGTGYFWQNHTRSVASKYFSYSGKQSRNAYWGGYSSGSGHVDSIKTQNVYGWCSNIS